MIRYLEESDLPTIDRIHAASELPENCLPNMMITNKNGDLVPNPLFVVKGVVEYEGQIAMMSCCKVQGELYLLVDHTVGTPEQRWEWLVEFKEWMKHEAWRLGLEQLTAWVPPELEESFGKRMLDLGFVKSPYQAFTLNLED